MEKPKIENFNLNSVKLLNGGGLAIKYDLAIPGQDFVDHLHGNEQITVEPSPDLTKILDVFVNYIAKIYKLDAFRTVLSSDKLKVDDKVLKAAEEQYKYVKEMIDIKGVNFSNWEKDDSRVVQIIAVLNDDSKQVLSMNSGKIHLSKKVFGFEADLEESCEEIIKEVFMYRFGGKRLQMTIPGFQAPTVVKTLKTTNKSKEKETASA